MSVQKKIIETPLAKLPTATQGLSLSPVSRSIVTKLEHKLQVHLTSITKISSYDRISSSTEYDRTGNHKILIFKKLIDYHISFTLHMRYVLIKMVTFLIKQYSQKIHGLGFLRKKICDLKLVESRCFLYWEDLFQKIYSQINDFQNILFHPK